MKTSLIIEDKVFKEAKKESVKSGKSISKIINQWVILGQNVWKKKRQEKKISSSFKPVNLGQQKLDLSSREKWMESLEDDCS